MKRGAVFSPCGDYRYALWRNWHPAGSRLLVVGLNPSTADGERDDPTSRRCIAFARQWGFGSLWLANLYAWRSPRPSDLRHPADPVGPLNDHWLSCLARESDAILVAWGAKGARQSRARAVLEGPLSGYRLTCLGRCRSGAPRHPLYLKRDTCPQLFDPPLSERKRSQ